MNNTRIHRQLHKVKDKLTAIVGGVNMFCKESLRFLDTFLLIIRLFFLGGKKMQKYERCSD